MIVVLSGLWTWYAREHKPSNAGIDDVRSLNSAMLALLTFTLAMRLNSALQMNRDGFSAFCDMCSALEMFHQRILMMRPRNKVIVDAALFIPTVVKHVLRGDMNVDKLISDFKKDYMKGDHELQMLNPNFDYIFRSENDYSRQTYGVEDGVTEEDMEASVALDRMRLDQATNDTLLRLHNDNTFQWNQKLDMLISHELNAKNIFKHNGILKAWTLYRRAAATVGDSIGYESPIGFAVVMWCALLVYIYTLPFTLPAQNSTVSCIATSSISVFVLIVLHVNAAQTSNPFRSSSTFQTVTEECRISTHNLISNVRIFRERK